MRVRTLLLLLAIVATPATALGQARSWGEANAAYKDGRYSDAIRAYESLAAAGVYHEHLFYNLGNAYFRNQQLGPAIYNYERALRIEPHMQDARFNLDLARDTVGQRVIDRLEGAERGQLWIRAVTSLSTSQILVGFLAINGLFFALLIVLRYLGDGFVRSTLVVTTGFAAVALALSIALLSGHLYYIERVEMGVIVADQVVLREGPDEKLAERAEVHPGLQVRILSRSSGWLRLRLSNGVEGWAPEHTIGEL